MFETKRAAKSFSPAQNENYFSFKIFASLFSLVVGFAYLLDFVSLPAKYNYDSNTIELIAKGVLDSLGDRSFQNIANVIVFLNLENFPAVGHVVNLLVFYFAITRYTSSFVAHPVKQIGIASAVGISIVIGTVYFGQFTKEIIPLIINIFILSLSRRQIPYRGIIVLILIIVLTYASYFRLYWYVTALAFLLMEIHSRLKIPSGVKRMIAAFSASIALYLVGVLNFLGLNSVQSSINTYRVSSEDALTTLSDYPEFIPEWLHWPYRLVSLFFPYILVRTLSWPVIFFGTFFLLVFVYLFYRYKKVSMVDEMYKTYFRYLVAHLLALSLFTPDYGSFVKHMSPFLPIICFLLTRDGQFRQPARSA